MCIEIYLNKQKLTKLHKMNSFDKIISGFKGKKILIIGDLMLDKYIDGEITRISPEAPVPILKMSSELNNLGGAGNVASNISSLGGKAILFSFIGKDNDSKILKDLMVAKNVEYFLDSSPSTITKTRICCKNHQFVRIDLESTEDKFFSKEMKAKLLEKADECDAIIVSDYLKGSITPDLIELLFPFKSKTIVDTKPSKFILFKGFFLIKPNEAEAKEFTKLDKIEEIGEKMRETLSSNILITRGEKGISLFPIKGRVNEVPTFAKEVCDVSGAGDTVIATLSLAIASGASLEEAAIIANQAAGISVEKKGTYSPSYNELINRINSHCQKIVSKEILGEIIAGHRAAGKKIVWTNGCFDILHTGHLRYLKDAKNYGDILVVGLDSDEAVKKLKGPGRPVNNEEDRAEVLSNIFFVDYVVIFPYGGAKDCIELLRPDIYVKGGDYTIDTINPEERKLIESYGGRIFIATGVPGKSTTNIIKQIGKNSKEIYNP